MASALMGRARDVPPVLAAFTHADGDPAARRYQI
jgi:hypothetical protein